MRPLEKGKIIDDIEHTDHNFYVGLVIISPIGRVLLGKRQEDGIWTGPGGSAEGNETPKETAAREAFEEAGLLLMPERLIELETLKAADGKPVFCFLYQLRPEETDTFTHLDPDKEVKKWEFYSYSEIPEDVAKDSNRHQALMNGLMKIRGLKKSDFDKGGPGSGRRGHVSSGYSTKESREARSKKNKEELQDSKAARAIIAKYNLTKDELSEIRDLAAGAGVKPSTFIARNEQHIVDNFKKSEVYKDESMRHMDEACKYSDLSRKLKDKIKARKELDKNYEAPESAKILLDDSKMRVTHHKEQYGSISKKLKEFMKKQADEEAKDKEVKKGGPGSGKRGHTTQQQYTAQDRGGKYSDNVKQHMVSLINSYNNWKQYAQDKPDSQHAKRMANLFRQKIQSFKESHGKYMKKSLIVSESEGTTATAIDTADYSINNRAAEDWLDAFRELMTDYNYGDAPRVMPLSRGYSIMMSKVDDGLYSGYIQQSIDRDGESQLDENVAKVDKQTLPDIVQYLKAREYLISETYETVVEKVEEELAEEEPADISDNYSSNKIRFMELLNEMLSRV